MVLCMASFWVIGGEYTDTTFTKLIAGKKKEKYGPFRTYDQAFAIWSEKSWNINSKNSFKKFQKSRDVLDGI